jgi:colanic acid/amylovoran biosynthesis glycosyltransferase
MPNPPTVAVYVPEFLKLDMMHVYRQITAFESVRCHVFTHKVENPEHFNFHVRRLHVLPKPRLRWWRRWVARNVKKAPWQLFDWELRHFLLELTRVDAQLLHVFFGHIAPQFRTLMKIWPHPVVVSFHGADAGVNMDKPGHLKAMREVFALADKMLCRTESLGRDLVALGCPAEKIAIWRTGVPLAEWRYLPREVPEEGAWKLLQVCRFVDKKGLDLTLEAFAEIKKRHPKAELTLVGDGPKMAELKAQAERLGLGSSVTFPGFLPQVGVKKLIYQSHLFLHPSRTTADGNREGIPNAALEAMASGMPVIATTHGGFPEAIESGISGVLVEENRADLLAQAALQVMENNGLLERLIEGGRRAVETKFDRAAQVKTLEGYYQALICECQIPGLLDA